MPNPQARTTLTDKGIEALKPQPGKRMHVFDSIVPGLCVRVTEGGSKSFVLVTHYKGKQKWLTLGHPGGLKLADARDQARDAILKSKRGERKRSTTPSRRWSTSQRIRSCLSDRSRCACGRGSRA